MNFAVALFAPIGMLLPAVGDVGAPDRAQAYPEHKVESDAPVLSLDPSVTGAVPESAWQVRIERRMTIRITPLAPQTRRSDLLFGVPNREIGPRFSERKMGKCVAVSSISGVQPGGPSRLLLFLRDQRIVSAELERACRSRDFYSGFYLARSNDGRLCVDRDTLLSRSGANCKLARMRQLVEADD